MNIDNSSEQGKNRDWARFSQKVLNEDRIYTGIACTCRALWMLIGFIMIYIRSLSSRKESTATAKNKVEKTKKKKNAPDKKSKSNNNINEWSWPYQSNKTSILSYAATNNADIKIKRRKFAFCLFQCSEDINKRIDSVAESWSPKIWPRNLQNCTTFGEFLWHFSSATISYPQAQERTKNDKLAQFIKSTAQGT